MGLRRSGTWIRLTPNTVKISAASTILTADDDVLRFVPVDGELWVLTRRTVYKATDAQATVPLMAGSDDFAWAVGHFGRLWAWGGKEIIYYDTGANEWKGTGIRGLATRGACTVGSYLVVVVDDLVTGDPEMWVYDGRGWFMLEDGSTAYDYPVSIYGAAADADMLAGRGTTSQHAATWQFFDRSGAPALRSSFEVISAMMDAGERDLDKVWRRAGVEIATPDDRATADSVTVALSYSVDGGASWVAIDSQNLTRSSSRLVSVGGAIAAKPTSRFIQLKVAVSSDLGLVPGDRGTVGGTRDDGPSDQAAALEVHGAADRPSRYP